MTTTMEGNSSMLAAVIVSYSCCSRQLPTGAACSPDNKPADQSGGRPASDATASAAMFNSDQYTGHGITCIGNGASCCKGVD